MNEDEKLQMIISLLQQANKSLARSLKLMEFLAGEKIKNNTLRNKKFKNE